MKANKWSVTLSAVFAGIALAVLQNKTIPCITILQDVFSISMSTAGWLSSVFCVMGIIMAFPGAVIVNKLGVKRAGLLSLVCAIFGSLIGTYANSVVLLMFSRIVEGAGIGLIVIIVPSIISMWFPPEKRGLPMGMWSSWQFAAQAFCFFFGVSLTNAFGWRGVWWCSTGIALFALFLYAVFVKDARPKKSSAQLGSLKRNTVSSVLRCKSVWFVSIAMLCFNFGCFGFVTWAAPCWTAQFSIEIEHANRWISILSCWAVPLVVVIGYLLDKFDHHKFSIAAFFLYIFVVPAAFLLPGENTIPLFVFIYPFFDGAVAAGLWTLAPQTVRESEQVPMAIALLSMLQNVGMLIGPPIVGAVIERWGWSMAVVPLVAVTIIGTLLTWRIRLENMDLCD